MVTGIGSSRCQVGKGRLNERGLEGRFVASTTHATDRVYVKSIQEDKTKLTKDNKTSTEDGFVEKNS